MKEENIIISLGGSLIIPEEIDKDFLKSFKELIISHVKKGKKFVIITGGGKVCRKYQSAAQELSSPSHEDLDWIGIASLKLNAELLRVVFSELANKKVVDDLANGFSFENSIVVGSAYEPGHSTDYDAVLAANTVGAKKIINLSNTDYVYDKDPKTNPDAKKIEKISWAEYRALIPTEWNPGLNSPFDPIASEMAEKEGITVVTMNGKNIENLEKCLNNEEFAGTTIY
ncbi:MAG: UMP kinase [Candidatus Nomurabacteria bacterium]|nr:UMP kinase [Candidatus Nomurabacteria bacterium]